MVIGYPLPSDLGDSSCILMAYVDEHVAHADFKTFLAINAIH